MKIEIFMDLDRGVNLGYRLPDCLPVIAETMALASVQALTRRQHPEEGKDYLAVDEDTVKVKIDLLLAKT